MNYLDDNTLQAIRASQLNKTAFVSMPGGMPEEQAQGGAPPQGGPPQGGAPMGPPPGPPQGGPPQGGPPQGDPSMGGGAPMGEPVPQEIIPILQQMGIQVDPQTGMAVDPETGQPIPTEMVMQVLQENGMLGGGDPAMGGAPMGGDPTMGGDPSMGGGAPMPPEPAPAPPQEPLLPPDSVAMASKEEFKAIMADVLKRDLPGLLKQELPTLLQPLLKEAVAQVLSGQYQGDDQLLTSIADSVASNNEILNSITGVL